VDASCFKAGSLFQEEGAKFIAMTNAESSGGLSALIARLEALDAERAALAAEIDEEDRAPVHAKSPPSKVNSAAVRIRVNLGRDRTEQFLRDSTELKTQRRKKFS
jgi:hypothetical protein